MKTLPHIASRVLGAPLLIGQGAVRDGKWNTLLSDDYRRPRFHISYLRALGRRLRKNYGYILAVQGAAYVGKIAIHPTPLSSAAEFFDRAAIGPVPGELVVLAGLVFHGGWIAITLATLHIEKRYRSPGALISIA